MILSFKKQFPEKILDGTKIHTIRPDPHYRWKAGRKIHFATGARTKNYNCFKEGECIGVEEIEIWWEKLEKGSQASQMVIFVDGRRLPPCDLHVLAINDGFRNVNEFALWFCKDFKGRIIHWTHTKYG